MFTGLSEEICKEAWAGVQPLIEHFVGTKRFNKFKGTVVVVDPRVIDRPKSADAQVVFDNARIFMGFVGDDEDEKYTAVALSKAFVTWKTGLPSSIVQQQHPYTYSLGDTIWGGSTVTVGGLIVAFSGVQQVHDEAISEIMASLIRSICRDEMTMSDGVLDTWQRTEGRIVSVAPMPG